ncbi:glycosyl transferase group 1 [Thioalkalivibrio sp. K90mix]|uniref:glycosyltransferase n=1 Tax=Thioalkalivibrio sp. (strain K90mix) TaxID=396595 RepID=UPI000195A5D7|nr:glycosyltransferase [Thioalkalivibrio sp. K90mix]ADC72046.1 glycosyl transferase group 1 [Thioalkalivibrio sp. K90mix]
MSDKSVLVTGATGFVGSAVIRKLAAEGCLVPVAGCRRSASVPAGVEQAVTPSLGPEADWRGALQGVEAVVHAAARVHVMDEPETDPLEAFRRVNVEGTLRLARQAVILQNTDDQAALIRSGGLRDEKAVMIRGSGVDLAQMPFRDEVPGVPIVAFAARLLQQKGVEEFVAAARKLRERGISARFWLIGDPDPGNPYSITAEQVEAWAAEGMVEVMGHRSDVPELYAQAHVVSLPSYYGEGLPKTLIEGAACGRPIVTTDHPGCRDAIEDGVTGLLVPIRDAGALADALQRLIENPEERRAMGRAGREFAEREFAIEKVVDAHMAVYRRLLSSRRVGMDI